MITSSTNSFYYRSSFFTVQKLQPFIQRKRNNAIWQLLQAQIVGNLTSLATLLRYLRASARVFWGQSFVLFYVDFLCCGKKWLCIGLFNSHGSTFLRHFGVFCLFIFIYLAIFIYLLIFSKWWAQHRHIQINA